MVSMPDGGRSAGGPALWKVEQGGRQRWARGRPGEGPVELLDGFDLDTVLAGGSGAFREALVAAAGEPLSGPARVLAPLQSQEVWASGVTFERSRVARNEEAGQPDFYDRVYLAERPELFFKAAPGAARGPGDPVAIRSDSGWDVPEPEMAFLISAGGDVVGCTIGNDMSSRAIEGANPLYLPQAKVYRGSCAVGPCVVAVEDLAPIDDLVIGMEVVRDGTVRFFEEVGLSQMRRKPDDLADWLLRAMDFPVGVLLLGGTSIVPGETLAEGDTVTVRVAGIGELSNRVEVLDASPRRRLERSPG